MLITQQINVFLFVHKILITTQIQMSVCFTVQLLATMQIPLIEFAVHDATMLLVLMVITSMVILERVDAGSTVPKIPTVIIQLTFALKLALPNLLLTTPQVSVLQIVRRKKESMLICFCIFVLLPVLVVISVVRLIKPASRYATMVTMVILPLLSALLSAQ